MRRLLLPVLLLITAPMFGCAAHGGAVATSAAARHATDRTLDLAIDGDGYFIVQTAAGGFLFTRSGEMAVSTNGEMVNADGYRLYPPIAIPVGAKNITITPDGAVRREVEGGIAELVGQIVLSRFDHADQLEKDGVYYLPTEASGEPITGRPNTKGLGGVRVGELED
ncbi:MAG: flgG [Phycisphaerales bacterium]|nr:flgG [Phycisphaerales bacterium]